MADLRVYVGGFAAASAQAKELRERLDRVLMGSDCRVEKFEIAPKSLAMDTKGFGYLTLAGPTEDQVQAALQKLVKAYHRTKWQGNMLRIELARPDYMHQLRQEWNQREAEQQQQREARQQLVDAAERAAKTDPKDQQNLHVSTPFAGKKTIFSQQQLVDALEEESAESLANPMDSSETDSEDMSDAEESNDDEAAEDTDSQVEDQEEEEEEDEEEEAAQEMEEAEEFAKQIAREEANARRVAALAAREEEMKKKKMTLGKLSTEPANKKIVFETSDQEDADHEVEDDYGNEDEDQDDDETQLEHKVISHWMDEDGADEDHESDVEEFGVNKTFSFLGDEHKTKVTGDRDGDDYDDDEEEQEEEDKRFRIRPEFAGEKGRQLFELQKRFHGDERFRFDARFMEEDEYTGNDDVTDDAEEMDESIQQFDHAQSDLAQEEAEMQEEQDMALEVIAELFPGFDVERVKHRLKKQKKHKGSTKEASWLGQMKRYDPTMDSCKQFEIHDAPTGDQQLNKSDEQRHEEEEEKAKLEEKRPLVGGDRFFTTSNSLTSLFTRVRKNSEDGEEGEAALDGIGGATTENATFKLSSLFGDSFATDDLKDAAKMIEDDDNDDNNETNQQESASPWHFTDNSFMNNNQDDDLNVLSTDGEEDDEEENNEFGQAADKSKASAKKPRADMGQLVNFGASFVRPESFGSKEFQEKWIELRKKLTVDFKRKRKDALKAKKRARKAQPGPKNTSNKNSKRARIRG